jgi:F420H(2)-dependent quinone reductase
VSEDREYRQPGDGWVRTQLTTIEETGDTREVNIMGRPVVVVEILGAKSGLWRKVPLMRVEHDGVYAAVASKGGSAAHPVWFHSITANPDVRVQDGTETHDARARLLTGEERAIWWERCVEAFPPYADYQTKTDREIPVFVLTPVD